jgi:hypothetical protein
MRPIPAIAHRQCGVFSYAQAIGAGWSPAALRHACRTGQLISLRVGAFQLADLSHLDEFEQARWRHAAPAIGAVLMTPGASASHSTSAVLRGLPLLFVPELSCVSVVPWLTGDVVRVHVHRCTAAPMSMPVGEVACLSTERTLIDMCREHGAAAGLIPLDFALGRRWTDADTLRGALDRCRRWPGVRAAREAIAMADGLSESPLESHSRFKFAQFGLPTPELQVSIANEDGEFIGRVDFYWGGSGIVGEADGATKYDGTDPEPLHREKQRQDRLAETGLETFRWGWRDLQRFEIVAERFERARGRALRRSHTDRRWRTLPRVAPHFDPAEVADERFR